MVKKLISVAVVGGVAVIGACFGDGPVPTAPTGATVLFTGTPAPCHSQGQYIGPVAFGSNQGYVTFLTYQPNNNDCGGGGGPQQVPQDVFAFNLEGGTLTKLGSAGQTDFNTHDQLAANGSGYVVAYLVPGGNQPGSVNVFPPGSAVGGNMGNEAPIGLAVAGSDVFLATEINGNTTGGTDLENPSFPSSGNGPFNGPGSGTIYKIGTSGAFTSWSPNCGGLDRCLVANAQMLVVVAQSTMQNKIWEIRGISTGSGALPTTIASSGNNGADFPFGLDIDGQYVAWSTTQSCAQNMTGGNNQCRVTDCNISIYDTMAAMPMAKTLLSSTQMGCMDAKLADGYVYFTINTIVGSTNNVSGQGVGRVKIADRTFESLDLGIQGPAAGPRRVFPIGDQLYLIDPLVMARIPKSALDGKHDFIP